MPGGKEVMWKKQVADALTVTRSLLAVGLVWLGFAQGAAGLTLAVALLLAAWITDVLDGPLARSSGVKTQTWVGAHDIVSDVLIGTAALLYLERAGFVDGRVAAAYLLTWAIVFWRLTRVPKPFGALFQAPIYAWFIWISLQQVPQAGVFLVVYPALYLVLAWRYVMRQGLPELLHGLQEGATKLLPHIGNRGSGEGQGAGGSAPERDDESPVDGQAPKDTR
jgi:cardiolipin synthase (CMP-forming)